MELNKWENRTEKDALLSMVFPIPMELFLLERVKTLKASYMICFSIKTAAL